MAWGTQVLEIMRESWKRGGSSAGAGCA
jgi:hypothetical protein